jgi:glycosyltransferase involved in cell wall biosynthesis
MQYIIDDNETGFLVEKFDVEAISKKLNILCLDADLRQQFGDKGYVKAMKDYTEERYVKDVADLYTELILNKQLRNN